MGRSRHCWMPNAAGSQRSATTACAASKRLASRWRPSGGYAAYLTKKLGVPVNVVRGTDYAAVVEAMRAGQVQFASIGPANYALANKVMGDLITPVAVQRDKEGALGYYSVIAVRADSTYQSIEDIKGKSFA